MMKRLLVPALFALVVSLAFPRAVCAALAAGDDLLPMRGIDGRYGYIDRSGVWKVAPRWAVAERFRGGIAVVEDALGRRRFIRPDGTLLTEGEVLVWDPQAQWIPVRLNQEYLVIDRAGKTVLPARKEPYGRRCGDVLLAGDGFSGRRILDLTGKELVKLPSALYEVRCFSEDLAATWTLESDRPKEDPPEGWGFIDRTGAWAIPPTFMSVRDFHDGVAFAERAWQWRLIDKEGKDVVADRWQAVNDFSEGLAAVQINAGGDGARRGAGGLFGYIDRTGRLVIAVRYQVASAFKGGLAMVKGPGGYGIIDAEGRERVPTTFADAWSPAEGIFCATKGPGAAGCVDLNGRERIPFVYDGYGGSEGGLVAMVKDKTWSVMDLDGKTIATGRYDQGVYQLRGAFRIDEGGRQTWMDRQGKVIASSDWGAAKREWEEADKAFAKRDNGRGIERVKKLAAQGHPDAMEVLSEVYSAGLEGDPDPVKARSYYEKALAAGSTRAMLMTLATRLPQDSRSPAGKEELAMLERAAADGEPTAMVTWGMALLDGSYGVVRQEKEGMKALAKAAEKDSPEGKRTYAVMLYRGRGGEKPDLVKVFNLMKQAAEAGHVEAAFDLGQLYERGLGTQKDPVQALRWYDEAAAKGFQNAKAAADSLRAASSPATTSPSPAPSPLAPK